MDVGAMPSLLGHFGHKGNSGNKGAGDRMTPGHKEKQDQMRKSCEQRGAALSSSDGHRSSDNHEPVASRGADSSNRLKDDQAVAPKRELPRTECVCVCVRVYVYGLWRVRACVCLCSCCPCACACVGSRV